MPDQPATPRRIEERLRAAITRAPVVLLTGVRQSGKSTLASAAAPDAEFATLDDAATLALARRDPDGLLDGLGPAAVIDEVQRAPELLSAIIAATHGPSTDSSPTHRASTHRASTHRSPGRLLLTASVNPLGMAGLADCPDGAVESLHLHPFSQGEIRGVSERFIDRILTADPADIVGTSRDEVIAAALVGGYPRVQSVGFERQGAWFRSYVSGVLDRDIRDLAQVGGLAPLHRMLELLAARSGTPLNAAGLARDLGVPNTSLRRYLALLEAAYLVVRVPAWSGATARRLARAPRLFLVDSGLMAHFAGITEERLAQDPATAGPLIETFVALELLKQTAWSRATPNVSHFRTEAGHEVDLLLQSPDGGIVGIDIRAGLTVGPADLRGLSALRDLTGRRFRRGVLLYLGRETMPLEDRVWAVPVAALWSSISEGSRAGAAAGSAAGSA